MPLPPKALPAFIQKLILGLSVSAVCLGVAEWGARLAYGPPSAPVRVFSVGRPQSWFSLENGWVNVNFQHQNIGRFPVRQTQRRFAVLGGSCVHGGSFDLGVSQEFAALLGEKVGAQPLNLGSPSLDTHDLLGIVETVQKYPMDAWVIYSGHNDFGNTHFYQRYRGWSGGMIARLRGLFERSQVYWQIRGKLGFLSANTSEQVWYRKFQAPPIDAAQKAMALRHFGLNMQRILWEAEKVGVPVVLVVPPRSLSRAPVGKCIEGEACGTDLYAEGFGLIGREPALAADLLQRAADADSIPIRILSSAQDVLRGYGDQRGIYVVDTPRLLPQEDGVPIPAGSLFQDQIHLTAQGHQQVAEVIAPFLEKALSRTSSNRDR